MRLLPNVQLTTLPPTRFHYLCTGQTLVQPVPTSEAAALEIAICTLLLVVCSTRTNW